LAGEVEAAAALVAGRLAPAGTGPPAWAHAVASSKMHNISAAPAARDIPRQKEDFSKNIFAMQK
jgi:hypothetical protein